MRVAVLVLAVLASALGAVPARAAEPAAASGVRRGQKYVGEPFGVFVRAEGFDEEPQPECKPGPLVDGVSLRFVGVRPQVSSFVQQFNGKRTEERKVIFTYEFEATVDREAGASFAPFVVTQGSKRTETKPLMVSVLRVPADPTMSIALEIPPGSHAPGERVPVSIVWSFAGTLEDARNVNIRSRFFDDFRFEDAPPTAQGLRLPIITKNGVEKINATFEKTRIDGKAGVKLKATRIWRVEKAGTFEFPPITAQMERVTRWRRTLFGDREPTATRRVRAVGKPLTITVESLPTEGRPKSFAGAVGRGFSIEATADRTVVRAGDPIRLTVKLRGDGNLDAAGLPPLTDGGGLDPNDFRQADAEATGQVQDGVKTFEVTVRVEHDRVANIPPIEYAWWNPTARRYETSQSKPIALQVGEAKVVSAKDVVSAKPRTNDTAPDSTAPTERATAQLMSGADLALVEDLDRLREQPAGPLLPWLLYGVSALVLGAAFVSRRRARVDPIVRERRNAAAIAASAIAKAARLPALDGAKQAAETLRSLRATHPEAARPAALDDVLARLDAIAYRPASNGSPIPADLLDSAKDVAKEIGR